MNVFVRVRSRRSISLFCDRALTLLFCHVYITDTTTMLLAYDTKPQNPSFFCLPVAYSYFYKFYLQNSYFNCNNLSQFYGVNCIFDQINPFFVSMTSVKNI